ncbi:MAG: hypothetical protein QXG86_02660 [Candidatus Woesearchaeota archaeon]
MFSKKIKKSEDDFITKLKKSYAAQIRRKEEEIEQLKRENNLLMKTALKQSENASKWMDYAKKLEKKLKEVKN